MTHALFSPRRREHAAREAERQELLASLASTRALIQQAYGSFNTVSDSDLIESYVFEIKALQSRYDYLLRRPLGRLLRLAARSSVGLAVLALFSQVSPLIGVSLGVNPVNALVLGVLGAPGFGLLLMLQWALR